MHGFTLLVVAELQFLLQSYYSSCSSVRNSYTDVLYSTSFLFAFRVQSITVLLHGISIATRHFCHQTLMHLLEFDPQVKCAELKLYSAFRPVNVVCWKRAICLEFIGKVSIPDTNQTLHISSEFISCDLC
jgi:hypothetical protein